MQFSLGFISFRSSLPLRGRVASNAVKENTLDQKKGRRATVVAGPRRTDDTNL